MTNVNKFGKRLAEARKKRQLSQKELAEKIGCDHTLISQYERGGRLPSFPNLLKILRIVGRATSVPYLLGLND